MGSAHISDRSELREAVRRAVPNMALRDLAMRLACSTARASDYILQAPVLALAVTFHRAYKTPAERNAIVGLFAERCRRGPKLRDLMAQYGVAYGLRALRGGALKPSRHYVIVSMSQLTDLHPSALAQAIPETALDQKRWLDQVEAWRTQMDRRGRLAGTAMAWAVVAARRAIEVEDEHMSVMADLVDFYVSPAHFDEAWSFDEARAAMDRWHAAQPRAPQIPADWLVPLFYVDTSFGGSLSPDVPVDYAPLPMTAEVEGFTFTALSTFEALAEEGRSMRHCVGSYYPDVVGGSSRIYAVTDGTHRATLELEPRKGGELVGLISVSVRQVRAYANARPPEHVMRAVAAFARSINDEAAAQRRLLFSDVA